jgi:hypothetical protein
MTVNRLTDDEVRGIMNWSAPLHCYWEELNSISQELLELRKENEMLRKMVEVGDELADKAKSLVWLLIEHFDKDKPLNNYCEQHLTGALIKYRESRDFGRESENQNET